MRGEFIPPTPEQAQVQREMKWRAKQTEKTDAQPVKIVEVSIPFWSLVLLMVQAAFAVIPATLIVFFIWGTLVRIFSH